MYDRIKTPFPYPGGKVRLSKRIIPELHQSDCYVEPFAGSLSVGLRVLPRYSRSILADIDPVLINAWKVIRDRPRELIEACRQLVAGRDEFYRCKAGIDLSDPVMAAARKIYIHRISYAGIGERARGINADCETCWKPERVAPTIMDASTVLQSADIKCQSWQRTLEQAPERATIYLDPPYVKAGNSLYRYAFTEKDHRELALALRDCNNYWVLSYDDHPLIKELYANYLQKKLSAVYFTGRYKTTKELLITSQFRNDGRTTESTQRLQRMSDFQVFWIVLTSDTIKEAAQKLGVGERTLYRRSIPLLRGFGSAEKKVLAELIAGNHSYRSIITRTGMRSNDFMRVLKSLSPLAECAVDRNSPYWNISCEFSAEIIKLIKHTKTLPYLDGHTNS